MADLPLKKAAAALTAEIYGVKRMRSMHGA